MLFFEKWTRSLKLGSVIDRLIESKGLKFRFSEVDRWAGRFVCDLMFPADGLFVLLRSTDSQPSCACQRQV
jgi:hypothetical protein